MPDRVLEPLLDNLVFPEGPRWHEGRLWFSDMHAKEVVAVDMDGYRETIVQVPQRPSGLGWLPDGRLLVVSMLDRKLLRLDPSGLAEHADLSGLASHNLNDMVVDGEGRAYVGNFGFDPFGGDDPRGAELILVTPDGEARVVADDVRFPNGAVVTPDGGTLIVAESYGKRLSAFDIAPDGSLDNRRVWAAVPGIPDGIALDADGCVWVAVPFRTAAAVRIAEGGEIKEIIEVDQDCPIFACALGGSDRRTLFLAEAITGDPSKIAQVLSEGNSNGGRIRTVTVDIPGAGRP
jgi:sugar lactone lactonase YvrE